MAPPVPLVALNAATIGFGGAPLFEGLSLGLSRGERACLVGRNGSGKSTLLKLLAGAIEPDGGARFLQQFLGPKIVPATLFPAPSMFTSFPPKVTAFKLVMNVSHSRVFRSIQ